MEKSTKASPNHRKLTMFQSRFLTKLATSTPMTMLLQVQKQDTQNLYRWKKYSQFVSDIPTKPLSIRWISYVVIEIT